MLRVHLLGSYYSVFAGLASRKYIEGGYLIFLLGFACILSSASNSYLPTNKAITLRFSGSSVVISTLYLLYCICGFAGSSLSLLAPIKKWGFCFVLTLSPGGGISPAFGNAAFFSPCPYSIPGLGALGHIGDSYLLCLKWCCLGPSV